MKNPHPILTYTLTLLACGFIGVRSTLAQEQPNQRYFTLNQIDAFLEIKSQFDQVRVRNDGRGRFGGDRRQTNRDWRVEERLGFRLAGTIVDPKFITYHGEFSFALTQDHFDEDAPFVKRSDSDTGYLLTYDMRVGLFQGKPLSGSFYGLRVDDRFSRRFQPTLNERRTGFGTSWYFAHDRLPMEITYDYLETDRTGSADNRDDEHFTESTFHYGAQWLISDHQRFKLSYDHSQTKQEYQGSARAFETTRDLWTLEHELDFGDKQQHELRTLIHWQEESGDFARDLFEFGPQLTLRHSDSLQTSYKYQFNRERFERLRVTQHRAEFQFVHQLYSNLTTTGNAFGLYEHVDDDIETYQYGASIDWQYNRRNPLGHLYTNLRLGFDNEDVRGDNGRRLVLNESATFHDPIAITLRNRHVVPVSVVVTDSSNRLVYLLGIDYVLVRHGVWTRLARIRTGRIADGDTVLIDYQYETPADGQLDSLRVDFGIEQRFKNGWTPYYRFSYRNQEVDFSSGFAVEPDRTDHHRVGVKLERERYHLGAEFEIFDDTIEPYDAFHLDGRYSFLRTLEHSLEGAARLSRFFFEGGFDDRNVTQIDLELDHRWHVSSSLSTTHRIAYRWEDDSVDGDTNSVDATAGLSYAVGDLSVDLTVEYDLLDLPQSKEDGFGVWLTVRRDFPSLFGTR